MCLFFALPVEILQLIINYLQPNAVEGFTLSCRYFHALAANKLIKHRKLKGQFSQVVLEQAAPYSEIGRHPGEILEGILVDADIALYPTHLTIGNSSHQNDARYSRDNSSDLADQLSSRVHQAVDGFCYHFPRCEERCASLPWTIFIERIISYQKGPITVLLLSLLENLEVIKFVCWRRELAPVLEIILDIVRLSFEKPRYAYQCYVEH